MTHRRIDNVANLSARQAYVVVEAMKQMFSRRTGKRYRDLKDIQEDMEVATDGQKTQVG